MEPARLKKPQSGWYHVTPAKNLAAITKHGLLVSPPRRVWDASTKEWETLGGIYLASRELLSSVLMHMCLRLREMDAAKKDFGKYKLAELSLELRTGTRFCLDEDELRNSVDEDEEYAAKWHQDDFGKDTYELVSRMQEECFESEGDNVGELKRDAADVWSCKLASAIRQSRLKKYMIRVFDPPVVKSARVVSCDGAFE